LVLTASTSGMETHVYAWGANDHGKCGIEGGGGGGELRPKNNRSSGSKPAADPSAEGGGPGVMLPTLVSGLEGRRVRQVSAGGFASGAVTSDGQLYCSGFAGNGFFLDPKALKRGIVSNPRPKHVAALTAPRASLPATLLRPAVPAYAPKDVLFASLGMRHCLCVTVHAGAEKELALLDALDAVTARFRRPTDSLAKQVSEWCASGVHHSACATMSALREAKSARARSEMHPALLLPPLPHLFHAGPPLLPLSRSLVVDIALRSSCSLAGKARRGQGGGPRGGVRPAGGTRRRPLAPAAARRLLRTRAQRPPLGRRRGAPRG